MAENIEYNDFIKAVITHDIQRINSIISQVVEDKDTTIIKCETCGEVIAFMRTSQLYKHALTRSMPPEVNYLIVKHMAEDRDHNITVPMPMGLKNMGFSQYLESSFKAQCNNSGIIYEEWLPEYVEHWKQKIGDHIE